MSSVPLFSGCLCLARGRPPGARWWYCAAAVSAGCTLLSLHGTRSGRHVLAGICCALTAGALYTLFTLAAAAVIRAGGPAGATMGIVFGGAGLLMAPYLAIASPPWLATPAGVGVACYLGLAATAGAYLLYGHGLRAVPVHIAAILLLTEPACATILAVTVLRDHLTLPAWTGLILLAATLPASALPAGGPGAGRLPGRHRQAPARPRLARTGWAAGLVLLRGLCRWNG